MKHPDDELSAYLDGECRRPEEVEAHLRHCPQCAERLEALRRVSSAVRLLQAPEVRPEFLTRVLAHAAEAPPARPAWHAALRWPGFAGMLTACAAVVFVATAYVMLAEPPPATPPFAAHESGRPFPPADDDALADHLARRPDLAERLETSDQFLPPPDLEDAGVPEEAVAALDDSVRLAELADEFDAQEDLDTIVNAMNDDERAAFIALLQEYQEEG